MADKYIPDREILEVLRYDRSDRYILRDILSVGFTVIVSTGSPGLDVSDTECERTNFVSHSCERVR
jgi:hypothetical protein